MPAGKNILRESGSPLFYPAGNPAEMGITAPFPHLGTAIRVAVRSLTVMQKEAFVASSRTGLTWRLASDEGAYLDGYDEAPCPLAFLSVGMVSSYMNEITALATQRGITICDIRLIQDNFYTMSGSGARGTLAGGAKDVALEVQIDADADAQTLQVLTYDAISASPLNGLMRGTIESLFSLTHNGRDLTPDKARRTVAPVPADPGAIFTVPEIVPPGGWSHLIVRTGEISPKGAPVPSAAKNPKDAAPPFPVIQLCVSATRRSDGMTEISQSLCNPQGSIFRFLSDETGRAPDAETYISAGIAFCFMTQLGRYAKAVKKNIHDYRILQDSHFSLAGASDGTGKAGSAAPLETHCYLETEHEDSFARVVLDMAEQSCFLHAFCKTDLKARVRIRHLKDIPPD